MNRNNDFLSCRTTTLSIENYKMFFEKNITPEEVISDVINTEELYIPIEHSNSNFTTRIKDNLLKDKITEKDLITLKKYLIRMAYRCTPFGHFSAVSLLKIDEYTNLEYLPQKNKAITLKSFKGLEFLNEKIAEKSLIGIEYKANETIYEKCGSIRYIEQYEKSLIKSYRLSEVESDETLYFVLCIFKKYTTLDSAIKKIKIKYKDYTEEEIYEFLLELISNGLILKKTSLHITSENYSDAFEEYLLKIKEERINPSLVEKNESNTKFEYHTDLVACFHKKQVEKKILDDVINACFLFDSFNEYKEDPALENFKNLFLIKYENRVVPLLEALDEDIGITFSKESGYSSKLLANLPILQDKSYNINRKKNTSDFHEYILNLVTEKANCDEIHLDEEIIKKIKKPPQSFYPSSLGIVCELYRNKENKTIAKLCGSYGPNSSLWLSRFSHTDKSLYRKIQKHAEIEQINSPDVIFAEIVHVNDVKFADIIKRKKIYNHEIVFFAEQGTTDDHLIRLSDLYIFVDEKKISLWCPKFNKIVIPRLSSAHAYQHSCIGIYNFLCSLQYQNISIPRFLPPEKFAKINYIPRITYKNVILYKKQWIIDKEFIEKLSNSSHEVSLTLIKEKKIDRFICFGYGDNILRLDLSIRIDCKILLNESKGVNDIIVQESLIDQYESIVKDKDNKNFANEFVIATEVYNPVKLSPPSKSRVVIYDEKVRTQSIDSDFIYLKIYCSISTAEKVISNDKISKILTCTESINKFFFIRYSDPDYHLRIRVFGERNFLYNEFFSAVTNELKKMFESGLIYKIETSTYKKEIERYGGVRCIGLAEDLFNIDSIFVMKIIQKPETNNEDARFSASLLFFKKIIESFYSSKSEALEFCTSLSRYYLDEFGGNKNLEVAANEKFRLWSKNLTKNNYTLEEDMYFFDVKNIIDTFNPSIAEIIAKYVFEIGTDSQTKEKVTSSIIHMHANRMFSTYNREIEFLIISFLSKIFRTELNRTMNEKNDCNHPILK